MVIVRPRGNLKASYRRRQNDYYCHRLLEVVPARANAYRARMPIGWRRFVFVAIGLVLCAPAAAGQERIEEPVERVDRSEGAREAAIERRAREAHIEDEAGAQRRLTEVKQEVLQEQTWKRDQQTRHEAIGTLYRRSFAEQSLRRAVPMTRPELEGFSPGLRATPHLAAQSATWFSKVPTAIEARSVRTPYVFLSSQADFKSIRDAFITHAPDKLVLLRKSDKNVFRSLRVPVDSVRVFDGLPTTADEAAAVHGADARGVPEQTWTRLHAELGSTGATVVGLRPTLDEQLLSSNVGLSLSDKSNPLRTKLYEPTSRLENYAAKLRHLLAAPPTAGTVDIVFGHSVGGRLVLADGSSISVEELSRDANHTIIYVTCHGLSHIERAKGAAVNLAQVDANNEGPVVVAAGRQILYPHAIEIIRKVVALASRKPRLDELLLELQIDPTTRVLGGVSSREVNGRKEAQVD